MLKGTQLEVWTPGKNRKHYLVAALDPVTGQIDYAAESESLQTVALGIAAGTSPPANAGGNPAPDPVGRSSSGGRGISAGLKNCSISFSSKSSRPHLSNCVAGFDWRRVGEFADPRTNTLCDDPR